MTADAHAGVLYILIAIVGFGTSTAFLRVAIVGGSTDTARATRVGLQTAIVIVGVAYVGPSRIVDGSLQFHAVYPMLNGILSGTAFICFSRGLESTEASVAKPLLTVGTVTTVVLGIVFLGEAASPRKFVGVLFAIAAVYLLTSE